MKNSLKTYLFLFTWLLSVTACGQVEQVRFLDTLACANHIDSIENSMNYQKKVIPSLNTEIYTALSYYPELDSTYIEFRYANIKTSLNARPKVGSLFRKRSKRKYVIRIRPNTKDSVATIDQVGLNGAVGVLGHELNHVIDYSKRSFCGILERLFNYASKKGKRRFEAEIDRMTIKKGLGWQLYDWEDYVLNTSKAKEKYKRYKRSVYYTPKELIKIIKTSQSK